MESKLFVGLGVLVIISGIILTAQRQYIMGISGTIVGIWLVWQNLKKINKKD